MNCEFCLKTLETESRGSKQPTRKFCGPKCRHYRNQENWISKKKVELRAVVAAGAEPAQAQETVNAGTEVKAV